MTSLKHTIPPTLCLALLLLSTPSYSQTKDTLYFFNGTKLVGELQKVRVGRVQFDADGVGVVSIKNHEINSMHAHSHHFRLEAVDKSEYEGYFDRSPHAGMTVLQSPTGNIEIAIKDISEVNSFGATWGSRTNGYVGGGYTYSKSTDIGRLNLETSVKYVAPRGETQLEGDMILTADSVQLTRERENATFGHIFLLTPTWITGIFLRYQRNLELGLQRRWQQVMGVGYEFLSTRNQLATALTGIAVNQELNIEEVETKNTEALILISYNLFSFKDPNINVKFVENAYVGLTQQGRFRSDGDLNISWEVISDFSLTLTFYHNFDNQSPATGEPNVDVGFVAGLRYDF